MVVEKKKGDHGGKETTKPTKSKKDELKDVELDNVSGGNRTIHVQD